MNDNKQGVINEVGDLGLGFYPITEQEEVLMNDKKEDKEN